MGCHSNKRVQGNRGSDLLSKVSEDCQAKTLKPDVSVVAYIPRRTGVGGGQS